MIPGKPYQAWENEARKAVMMQRPVMRTPGDGPIEIRVTVYYKGNRPDLSGCLESVGDCLQGLVYEDDGQIESWDGSRVIHDKDNPRTVVVIKEIVEG
jgi:Holliday junction resolvase RusA-like endonuclease